MQAVGLDLRYVQTLPEARTLFSFCFLYPDGTGGNLTTDDSASSSVTRKVVEQAEEVFKKYGRSALGLAVPEVPLEARYRLLESADPLLPFCVAFLHRRRAQGDGRIGYLRQGRLAFAEPR